MVRVRVARPGRRGLFVFAMDDRDLDPREYAAQELPEDLAAVARRARLPPGNRADGIGHRLAERIRQLERLILDAQVSQQVENAGAVAPQGREPRLPQGLPRHLAGDVGITVAIPADPGTELKQLGDLERLAWEMLGESVFSLGEHLRHHVEQILVEEIDSPG